jgi:hypothetical protein
MDLMVSRSSGDSSSSLVSEAEKLGFADSASSLSGISGNNLMGCSGINLPDNPDSTSENNADSDSKDENAQSSHTASRGNGHSPEAKPEEPEDFGKLMPEHPIKLLPEIPDNDEAESAKPNFSASETNDDEESPELRETIKSIAESNRKQQHDLHDLNNTLKLVNKRISTYIEINDLLQRKNEELTAQTQSYLNRKKPSER